MRTVLSILLGLCLFGAGWITGLYTQRADASALLLHKTIVGVAKQWHDRHCEKALEPKDGSGL